MAEDNSIDDIGGRGMRFWRALTALSTTAAVVLRCIRGGLCSVAAGNARLNGVVHLIDSVLLP